MTIYADIRTLLVAGLVLFLVKTGRTYPLPLHKKTYSSEKQLIITRKPCQDSIGNAGVCMFKYDCIRQKGLTLSTCVDGFLFGACCFLKESSSPKITDVPFENENEFNYQKQSNIISEAYGIIENTDFFNLSKYSNPENEISSTIFFSSHDEVNMNASTYRTTSTSFDRTEGKDTTKWQSENDNNFTNLSMSYVNTTDDNVKIVDYYKEENDQNYKNTKPYDMINNVTYTTKRNYYDSESIEDISSILDNTTISSYETQLFNSTEPSTDIPYKGEQNSVFTLSSKIVPTENWWMTTKLPISNMQEQTAQIEPIDRISNISIDYTTTLMSTTDLKILSAIPSKQKEETVTEKIEILTSAPFDEKKNSSELPHSNFTNFSEDTTQKLTTHQYEVSQSSNFMSYVDNATKIPTFTSEKPSLLATTLSQSDEKVTSKFSSNIEVLDEKSFTIYGEPLTNSTERDKESTTISSFTKDNPPPDESISSLDATTRTTTNVLPIASEWSAQNQLPASFQSLIAQLSSEEVPSPETSHLDFNAQSLQVFDENVNSEQNLPSEQTVSHLEQVGDVFSVNDTFNRNKDADSLIVPAFSLKETTLSIHEGQTDVFSAINDSKNAVLYANSYSTTDGNFSQTVSSDNPSNFKTTVHPDDYLHTISTTPGAVDSNGMNENSPQIVNTSTDNQFETSSVSEVLSLAVLLNISDHTTNHVLSHGGYTSTSTTDSTELSFNNPTSRVTSIFDFSNEKPLSYDTELDDELLETGFQGQVLNIPEIINNHSNKSTLTHAPNSDDKVDLLFISATQYPFLNYTTVVTEDSHFDSLESKINFSTTLYTSTVPSRLTDFDMATDMAQDDVLSVSSPGESNEITHILGTDANFTESSTSQNFSSEFTSLFTNHFTVNEISTIYNSTSPLDPSHELVEIVDFQEMNANGSQFTNITDENYVPNKIHENPSIHRNNFTVFNDDLDKVYENTSSVSISFSENIETYQLNAMNFTENHLLDTEFALDYDTEINISDFNISSLTNDVASETTTHSASPKIPLVLEDIENSTFIASTNYINEKEHPSTPITYSESVKISLPTSSNEFSFTNVKDLEVTDLEGIVENSTFSSNNFSVQTFTEIYSHTSIKNVTFSTSDVSVAETTQTYDETLTSQNSSALMETTTNSSIPANVSETVTLPVLTTSNTKWDYKKDCGVRLMQPIGRIVGGKNTYFGKWPWQALVKEATWLGLFLKNKCGGVLITAKYVLTAAHCQPGFFASLLVVLGTHDLAETFDNKASVIRNVKRMVVHRHYNLQTFENDLALLEMETPVEFSPYVVPICLPFRKEDFTNKMAFVTGWGKLTHGGDVPNILQEVQVPIVANGDCQRMFFHAGHQKAIRSNFVCAGYTNGGQDSCEGDSGGPLMVQREDNRWVLVGTVSHGIGCADPNLPGVYMRMSSYRPWIDSIINKHR